VIKTAGLGACPINAYEILRTTGITIWAFCNFCDGQKLQRILILTIQRGRIAQVFCPRKLWPCAKTEKRNINLSFFKLNSRFSDNQIGYFILGNKPGNISWNFSELSLRY
jgi:hypothetical protein